MENSKRKLFTLIIGTSISIAMGIAASLVSFYYTVQKPSYGINNAQINSLINDAYISTASLAKFNENKKFILEANALASNIKEGLNNPEINGAIQLSELKAKIDKLDDRINNIYQAIDSEPDKSLRIPSINKDINSLDEKIKYLSENFEHQIDRTYQILMWVCGTLVIGMITLVITVWLSFRSRP